MWPAGGVQVRHRQHGRHQHAGRVQRVGPVGRGGEQEPGQHVVGDRQHHQPRSRPCAATAIARVHASTTRRAPASSHRRAPHALSMVRSGPVGHRGVADQLPPALLHRRARRRWKRGQLGRRSVRSARRRPRPPPAGTRSSVHPRASTSVPSRVERRPRRRPARRAPAGAARRTSRRGSRRPPCRRRSGPPCRSGRSPAGRGRRRCRRSSSSRRSCRARAPRRPRRTPWRPGPPPSALTVSPSISPATRMRRPRSVLGAADRPVDRPQVLEGAAASRRAAGRPVAASCSLTSANSGPSGSIARRCRA